MLNVIPQGRFQSISEFEMIHDKKIGCGSFGTVRLARHKLSCRIYAIKVVETIVLRSNSIACPQKVKLNWWNARSSYTQNYHIHT